LRRELGAAGRRHVEQAHCWERCLEPFVELLGLPPLEGGASRIPGSRPAAEVELAG
jgi:hypothetical protein